MMNRGEVWWVNFDPSLGGEIQKTRPAVIVSNNVFNRWSNRLQVVPITSNVSRCYPGEALLNLNGAPCRALANQITTVAKQRFGKLLGRLSEVDLENVARAIQDQLYLD